MFFNWGKHRQSNYIKLLLIAAASTILVLQIPTLIIDPYKVFGVADFNKKNFDPNTRYLKIEYLLKHEKPNAFILGSSRVNFYDVEVAKSLSNYNYYNMTAFNDYPLSMRRKLEWLAENRKVSQIILGMDYDHQAINETEDSDLLRQEHPLVSGEPKLKFYYKYTAFQPETLIMCIQNNLQKEVRNIFDVTIGQSKLLRKDELRLQDMDSYVANNFKPTSKVEGKTKLIKEEPNKLRSIQELQKIIGLAKAKNIDTLVVVNPLNHHRFLSFDIDSYTTWVRRMVDVAGEVWDFSGINSITKNDKLYYEDTHFTKQVGDLVLSKVFNERKLVKDIPDDFGVLVTKENVESHLEQLKRIREDYKNYYQTHYQTQLIKEN
jgi:5'(3')-deoxyribonucleotidase